MDSEKTFDSTSRKMRGQQEFREGDSCSPRNRSLSTYGVDEIEFLALHGGTGSVLPHAAEI